MNYELIYTNRVESVHDALLSTPSQDSDNHILNKLPDHCLLTIFGASPITVRDLTEIANVCHRFHAIAITVFRTKHSQIDVLQLQIIPVALWRQMSLFRTFGPLITSFAGQLNDFQCRMAIKYCPHIKELSCRLSERPSFNMLPMLSKQLETLYLDFDELKLHFKDWFNGDSQLKRLMLKSIGGDEISLSLPNQNIPQLIELGFHRINVRKAERFFCANPQIQVLKLMRLTEVDLTLNNVLDSLPNLAKLVLCESVADSPVDHMPIPVTYDCNIQHTQLRTLKIRILERSMSYDSSFEYIKICQQMVQHNVPLENLTLDIPQDHSFVLANNFIDIVRQMPTIKSMDIRNFVFNADEMIRLVRELPNLTKLTIGTNPFDLNLRGFREFLEQADERLTDFHLIYVHPLFMRQKPKSFDGTELKLVAGVARDRKIGLKMTLRDRHLYRNSLVSMHMYKYRFIYYNHLYHLINN